MAEARRVGVSMGGDVSASTIGRRAKLRQSESEARVGSAACWLRVCAFSFSSPPSCCRPRRRSCRGGIEFREDGGEARTGRFARVGVSTGGDGFLDEGRVAHVEEFVVLVHLPTLLAHE